MQQEEIDQIKEVFHQIQAQIYLPSEQIKKGDSELVGQYISFFEGLYEQVEAKRTQAIAALIANGVVYHPDEFQQDININIVNHSADYQILEVDITLGFFTFRDITIVNISSPFPSHLVGYEGYGAYGKVYKVAFQDQVMVMKAAQYPRDLNDESKRIIPEEVPVTIKLLLRQYCMLKIASILEVGPRINNSIGFDIFIYNDCVAFAMQYLQNLQNSDRNLNMRYKLKESLLKLHAINFIHMDVKLQNVCFSTSLNEFVFIDYGFSKFIKEKVGEKTFTKFYGTAAYCCDDMNKLLVQAKGGLIDLYFNDVTCLINTFKVSREYRKSSLLELEAAINLNDKGVFKQFQTFILVHHLKYLANKLMITQFESILKKNINKFTSLCLFQLFSFIKRMSFSSNQFKVVLISLKSNYKLLTNLDNLSFSNKASHDFYLQSFQMMKRINDVDIQSYQNSKVTYLKGKQLLLNWEAVMKQEYSIYLRILVKYLQINSNCSNFQEKLKFSKVAKALISKNYIPELSNIAKQIESIPKITSCNDLEYISRVLFIYSLQGNINSIKTVILLAIVYNVVILELFSLNSLLQYYQSLMWQQFDFTLKCRLLLKFKTTIIWSYYDVRIHKVERMNIMERINHLNFQFMERQKLSDHQKEFFNVINCKYPPNPNIQNLKKNQTAYQSLLKGKYNIYLVDPNFMEEVKIWILSIFVYMSSCKQYKRQIETFIAHHKNHSYFKFQYFHLVIMANTYLLNLIEKMSFVKSFYQIFSECNDVSHRFRPIIFSYIISFRNSTQIKVIKLFESVKDKMSIQSINPTSQFGKLLNNELHTALLLIKNIDQLPPSLQAIFLNNQPFFINYNLEKELTTQDLFEVLFSMLKEQLYMPKIHPFENSESKLTIKFRQIYLLCKENVMRLVNKKQLNQNLLLLNLIATYIVYRKNKPDIVLKIMPFLITISEQIEKNLCSFIKLKSEILSFCLRLSLTWPLKRYQKGKLSLPIYKKYYEMVEQKSLNQYLMSSPGNFSQIFLYLIQNNVEKVAPMINRLSRDVMQATKRKIGLNYYNALLLANCNRKIIGLDQATILKNLDPVLANPYNVLYLHFSMLNLKYWSVKVFLQISKGLLLIDRQVTRLIVPNHFKCIILYNCKSFKPRKIRALMKQSWKGGENKHYNMTQSQRFLATLSQKGKFNRKNLFGAMKFDTIKAKIANICRNISKNSQNINQQGLH